jgi:tRNA (guanine10-N2)-dimethyltransferase
MVLGRQPLIGVAELERVLGAEHIALAGNGTVLSDAAVSDVPFARLGSVVKLAEYLGSVEANNLRTAQTKLNDFALACAQQIDEGKVQLGLSVYDVPASAQQLLAVGLNLKKTLRRHGYSARLVPNANDANELNSAQVLHNHLTGERGIELIVAKDGTTLHVGRTVAVQDINAYAARDQGRPKRDARVGMLPPKLAQTIVNLGVGEAKAGVVLDPFCGTGVVLQEASLMGFEVYGSDLEQRMIDFTAKNLEWLATNFALPVPHNDVQLEVGDATAHQWKPAPDFVACETYLGQPLSSWPAPEKLRQIIGTCNVIIEKFLRNISMQLAPGAQLCLAVPAWRSPNGQLHHLSLLDHLEQMGYNRVSFEHVRAQDLVYFRPDQLVTRELLVITRN